MAHVPGLVSVLPFPPAHSREARPVIGYAKRGSPSLLATESDPEFGSMGTAPRGPKTDEAMPFVPMSEEPPE